MQDSFVLTLNGEEALIECKNGKYSAKGYEIENEQIAAKLSGAEISDIAKVLLALGELGK